MHYGYFFLFVYCSKLSDDFLTMSYLIPTFSLIKPILVMKKENTTQTAAQESQSQTPVLKKRLPRKKKKLGKSGKGAA